MLRPPTAGPRERWMSVCCWPSRSLEMDFLSATSVLIEYSDTVFRKQAVSMETEPAVSRWLGHGYSESMGPRLRSGFWAGTSHVDAMCHGETQKMNRHPPSKPWLVIYTTNLCCFAAWAPDLSPWQQNAGNLPPSLRYPRGFLHLQTFV